jgi:teichuronic acid biosynthesis glycosyltransferase TuaC
MPDPLRVFMITSEWPTPEKPHEVPFIVRQVNFLQKAGVDLTLFPFRGRKNPANYAKAWNKARSAITAGSYDLVHAQWGQSGLLALPKTIPLVVTFRGDDLEGIIGQNGRKTAYGNLLRLLSKMVARAADQIILVSPTLARAIPNRFHHVIPSGLDLDMFCPKPARQAREKLGLDPHRRYVLFAGSVENPRKRYHLAKEAVDRLKSEFDLELLVASGLTHNQIPDFMNASDLLLLTSLHEGSPNVVKEALACNLPVVSTDVGDVRERIGNVQGCTVLTGDRPEIIADAVRAALHSGKPVNARQAVIDLDENILTQKVINVYRQAVKRN